MSEMAVKKTGSTLGMSTIVVIVGMLCGGGGAMIGSARQAGADQTRLTTVELQLAKTAEQLKRDLDKEEANRKQTDQELAAALADVRKRVEQSADSTNAKIDQVLFLLTGRAKP